MRYERDRQLRLRGEASGFALLLAIMALMLLTFAGLTVAITTSTELQIATNYRWSQQAYYNAEAGAELAKQFLRNQEWMTLLPSSRTAPLSGAGLPTPLFSRSGEGTEPTRNFENAACDINTGGNTIAGYQGYGVVLDGPTLQSSGFPFQNVSTRFGQTLRGTFTAWIRRVSRVVGNTIEDDPRNDRLVLTVEGTAPYIGVSSTAAFGYRNRAVRVLEQTLVRINPSDCENYIGQIGSGPTGAGYDQCDPVHPAGILGGVTERVPGGS